MRRRCTPAGFALTVALALGPAVAAAQDAANIDELKRQHGEAIAQLKAAQDRKNELAEENERLKTRLVELEKQLAERDKESAAWAERTWFYRSQYAAWDRFLDRYPRLREQWRLFLAAGEMDPLNSMPSFPAEPAVSRVQ